MTRRLVTFLSTLTLAFPAIASADVEGTYANCSTITHQFMRGWKLMMMMPVVGPSLIKSVEFRRQGTCVSDGRSGKYGNASGGSHIIIFNTGPLVGYMARFYDDQVRLAIAEEHQAFNAAYVKCTPVQGVDAGGTSRPQSVVPEHAERPAVHTTANHKHSALLFNPAFRTTLAAERYAEAFTDLNHRARALKVYRDALFVFNQEMDQFQASPRSARTCAGHDVGRVVAWAVWSNYRVYRRSFSERYVVDWENALRARFPQLERAVLAHLNHRRFLERVDEWSRAVIFEDLALWATLSEIAWRDVSDPNRLYNARHLSEEVLRRLGINAATFDLAESVQKRELAVFPEQVVLDLCQTGLLTTPSPGTPRPKKCSHL
jgi:hypothetical protein